MVLSVAIQPLPTVGRSEPSALWQAGKSMVVQGRACWEASLGFVGDSAFSLSLSLLPLPLPLSLSNPSFAPERRAKVPL